MSLNDTTSSNLPPRPNTAIVDLDRGFRTWNARDLWNELTGTGFLPNVLDHVIHDEIKGIIFEVTSVNVAKKTWTEDYWGAPQVSNVDQIHGGHYPLRSDKFRAFFDDRKHPATLVMDDNITFNGPDVVGFRIFRGNDVTNSGEILSGYYVDGSLKYTYLPMRSISDKNRDTVVKQPLTGHVLAPIEHGEAFTYLVYNTTGETVEMGRGHFIRASSFMASEDSISQVIGIDLDSPFVEGDGSNILKLPVNTPITSIPIWCKVTYADRIQYYPVDGSRVKLEGLRNSGSHDTYYLATNAGLEIPVSLSYELAKGETYKGDNLYDGNKIIREYRAITDNADKAFSSKVFVSYNWLDAARGYRLQYFMYDIERAVVTDVTAYANYTAGTVFDPKLYNYKQSLDIQIDLGKVDPKYKGANLPQSFHITLTSEGTFVGENARIQYNHAEEAYGEDVFATFKYSNVNYSELYVGCKAKSLQDWLDRLYKRSYPIYDRRVEQSAPQPTHFEVHVGGKVYTYDISQWNDKLVVDYRVENSATVNIRWIRRTPTDTLQLALSPMLAHYID